MSNAKHETVADIVKELRGIKGGQHTNGGLSFERWLARCQFADDYADRFEAAHQREVTELRKCLGAALEVVDSTAEKLGVINSVKSCEEYKMWRKVLELAKEAKDEGK